MLPVPFENFIPKFYERGAGLNSFSNKMDSIIQDVKNDVLSLRDIQDPMKCPSVVLDYLGNYFNAAIKQNDNESTKRIKIATAVQAHKRRGSFALDAKIKIDAIALGDSSVINGVGGGDWIITGDGLTPSSFYWSVLGYDGVDDEQGLFLTGDGTELGTPGNVYIDVDNDILSVSDQEKLELEMIDIVPCYFYVHFGYIDISGDFIEYFVMGV